MGRTIRGMQIGLRKHAATTSLFFQFLFKKLGSIHGDPRPRVAVFSGKREKRKEKIIK
jgi:hypothetical protein